MVRPRIAAARRTQEVNMAAMITDLQARLETQEQEMQALRAQIAQQNQGQPQGEVPPPPPALPAPAPPQGQVPNPLPQQAPVPPPQQVHLQYAAHAPPYAPVEQEMPPAPIPPAVAQGVMPIINQEPLYERFRRMKPPEFEGSTDPLEAEE